MKSLSAKYLAAIVIALACSSAHAAEFSGSCYAAAKTSAVKYVNNSYRTHSARAGQAIDGEGDDIHVQVQVNGQTVCVDVGVEQNANSCSLSGDPQTIDCNE